MIKEIHNQYNGLFGSYKIKILIENELGIRINHKRIERLMSVNNIRSTYRSKRKYKYRRIKSECVKENILNRNFEADNINKVWLTDITEVKIENKKYLLVLYMIHMTIILLPVK